MLMSEKDNRPEGVRPEVWQSIIEAENALLGNTLDEIPDVPGEAEFGGIVLDENWATDREREFVLNWLKKVVGGEIETLAVKKRLKSADGLTRVIVYDKSIGEMEYFLSKWTNEGEKPSYILWPGEMYEAQLEVGYEKESE